MKTDNSKVINQVNTMFFKMQKELYVIIMKFMTEREKSCMHHDLNFNL